MILSTCPAMTARLPTTCRSTPSSMTYHSIGGCSPPRIAWRAIRAVTSLSTASAVSLGRPELIIARA